MIFDWNHLHFKNAEKYISIIFASLTLILSISVIIGWHYNWQFLIQYKEETVAMVYDTAISFLSLSLCIIFLISGYRKTAGAISIIILLFNIVILMQYAFNIQLGIDELFFQHNNQVANKFAGRMAPNTATCFILISLSLFLVSFQKIYRLFASIAIFLMFFTLCLSILFISGYLSDIHQAYIWGSTTPMAVNTALGMILLSTSMVTLIFYLTHTLNVTLYNSLPYFLILGFFIAIALLFSEIKDSSQLNEQLNINLSMLVLVVGSLFGFIFAVLIYFALKAFQSTKLKQQSIATIQSVIESINDGILVTDNERKIIFCNHNFLELWGFTLEQVNSISHEELIQKILPQLNNKQQYKLLMQMIGHQPDDTFHHQLHLKNNNVYEQSTRPLMLDDQSAGDNQLIGRVWCYYDLTQQKQLEKELTRQATQDPLTTLPNKPFLINILKKAMASADQLDHQVAIMLIDLDFFAKINEIFGRSKGDQFLRIIAFKLQDNIPQGYTLGRFEGNKFLLITPVLIKIEDAALLAEHLINAFEEPFSFYGEKISLTASIGIALYPKNAITVDSLLNLADIALTRVKRNGRDDFQFYTKDMNTYTKEFLQFELELRQAIRKNQLHIRYQPIIDIKTGHLHGAEALVYWSHPEHGLIRPLNFIPIAEEIGYIKRLGFWVLKTVCQQSKIWQKKGIKDLKISVNISSVQFKLGMLKKALSDIIKHEGLQPEMIEIEITEGMLIDDSLIVQQTLNEIKEMGMTIAIDDFGTGYSSLSHLKKFDIDKLKIDKSFIDNISFDHESATLVKTIIVMAKNLNIQVVAKGVETKKQIDLLMEMGCDTVQGFYFSKPLEADKFTKYISK